MRKTTKWSMSELAGQPFISAYCASKGALATLTRNTAFAVMGNRIRVNQLDIGWMSSDNERACRSASWVTRTGRPKAAARLPFGRLIDPAEVTRVVNFMASDDAGPDDRRRHQLRPVRVGRLSGQAPAPDAPMRP